MKPLLAQLVAGRTLTAQEAVEAFELIMSGQATPAQIAAMLSLIEARGPAPAELVGAATVMRRKLVPVPVPPGLTVIDTCGTGGSHSRLFNVSTAAALVAAAVGRPRGVVVAKHGNRSVTSASGSSQVLEALGVTVPAPPEVLSRCLDEAGFCFCFAPAHHPAMKFAGPVRAELGFRTIFNLVGPLTNPAAARRQLLGVPDPAWTTPMARVLADLGAQSALVVHGRLGRGADAPGVGEVSTLGPTRISRLHAGTIDSYELDPRQLGLEAPDLADLSVDSPDASARIVRQVLGGAQGPARDLVCLNAAAALQAAGLVADLAEGLPLAAAALDSRAAAAVLDTVVRLTHRS